MALSAYAIPTLQEVKDFLGINNHDSDSILETWIDKVSYGIEMFTNRKIAVQSVANEIYDGDGTDTLYIRYWPLTQLSTETTPSDAQKLAAVQYRNDVDSSWTDICDDVDHILYDASWPFIKLDSESFPVGERNVRLNYKAGYSVIPGDIWQVSVEMIADFWDKSKRPGAPGKLGLSSRAHQNYSISYQSLRPEWREILLRYQLGGSHMLSSQRVMGR